jgi:hypothetical protein
MLMLLREVKWSSEEIQVPEKEWDNKNFDKDCSFYNIHLDICFDSYLIFGNNVNI